MSLIVHDTISLTTSSGVSSIQLCIGDITKLSKEEQVDVLVVSAFPGEVRCNQRRSTRPHARGVLGDFELQMLDVSTHALYSIICKLIM